jgi:hypothetical protein
MMGLEELLVLLQQRQGCVTAAAPVAAGGVLN